MKRTILAILLALALVVIPVSSAFAETTQDVTVTASPAILSISNTPDNWPIDSPNKMTHNTTYWSNDVDNTTAPGEPVAAADCRFTVTNNGDITADIGISFPDFDDGAATLLMPNSDTGSATATEFGAKAYREGDANSGAYTTLTVASVDDVITNLAGTETKNWGLQVETQTNVFTDGTPMQSVVVLTAEEHT
jgi:hypothetical protein